MSARVSERALLELARDLLARAGASAEQADAVARALVWSDLAGRASQGVWRLPVLCDRLRKGGIRGSAHLLFEKTGPATGVLRAAGGAGHHAAAIAMDHAIRLARAQGAGAVTVTDANYFGAGAYYVNRAADCGMLGIAASNSFAKVLAHGGRRPALGTNPLAFGAPRRNGEAILVDMATSEAAGSTVRRAAGTLQPGFAVDANGALLPLGGAKGYALAVMVELLCGVLAGPGIAGTVGSMYEQPARRGGNGHFMLAIDIERFLPLPLYYARVETLAAWLEATGDPCVVRLPGARRWEARKTNARQGIALDVQTVNGLAGLCAQLAVPLPACLAAETEEST